MAFIALWVRQLSTRNAGMVDPLWSWSMGAMGVLYALVGDGRPELRILVGVIAGLWGLRLGTHLYFRNAGKPEDGRYARLRSEWGAQADRRMLQFFILQAVFALLLSLGMWTVAWQQVPANALQQGLALLLAALSLGGEALADWQLESFRSQPANRGRVCRVGLWGWSRHPNYFFECLHWPCYTLLALGAPGWWITLLPPLVMVWLLLKVSGIPLNEAEAARKRPEYADYIRTVSAFIPLPPSKS
jgi:steroid 5-alpha reductase family enzyme